ncbi:LysR family transcriptional regulator [Shinella sp.]|uniref:LysR family transcriptional regulator n=1 Tax=Shinella sp. TaxID=1870904 RepID=UPI0029A3A614|nr:LysR family transcriptional regulator [Shinella sp.]MDX3975522.1 LysR family transcriptional regulator [Shinella sp.]
MDTVWLTDFLTLAETGSFSRAAEQRNLTQPAFSRRIRALEDWIGATLFDRSMVPVALTEPGRQFAPQARKLLEGIETAQRTVRAAAQVGATSLNLVTTDLLASGFAPMLLSLAEDWLGGDLVHVSVASPRGGEAMLMRGQCQLLLRHHHEAAFESLENEDFVHMQLAEDQLASVGVPELAALFNDGDAPPPVPLLAHEEDTVPGRIFAASVARRLSEIRFDIVFISQSVALLHAMALRGKGIAWLPLSLVRDDIARGSLHVIGASSWREPIDIVLIRNRSTGSKTLDRFWDELSVRGLSGSLA